MIGRLWHGWTTTRENADPYDRLPRVKVLPGIDRVRGYKGAYLAVVPPEARNLTTTPSSARSDHGVA